MRCAAGRSARATRFPTWARRRPLSPARVTQGDLASSYLTLKKAFDALHSRSELFPVIETTVNDDSPGILGERRAQQADFITAHPSYDRSLWVFSQRNPVRRFCQRLVEPAYGGERIKGRKAVRAERLAFQSLLFAAIIGSIAIAGYATPLYRRNYFLAHGQVRWTWFNVTEVGHFLLSAGLDLYSLVRRSRSAFSSSSSSSSRCAQISEQARGTSSLRVAGHCRRLHLRAERLPALDLERSRLLRARDTRYQRGYGSLLTGWHQPLYACAQGAPQMPQ